jgi:hypothetical protein
MNTYINDHLVTNVVLATSFTFITTVTLVII